MNDDRRRPSRLEGVNEAGPEGGGRSRARAAVARLRVALREPFVLVGLAVLAFVPATYLTAAAGFELTLEPITEGLDGALIAALVLAMLRRPDAGELPAGRRFWTQLSAGFAIWALLEIVFGFSSSESWPVWLAAVVEAGFLASYLLFLFAAFEDPERADDDGLPTMGRRRLLGAGLAVTGLTLFLYLVAVPAVVQGEAPATGPASYLLFVLLDGALAFRFALAAVRGRSGVWRWIHGLLGGAFAGWCGSDLLNFVHQASEIPLEAGKLADLLWYAPFAATLLAAGLRRSGGADSLSRPATSSDTAVEGIVRRAPLVLLALVPPLLHFGGEAFGLLADVTRPARQGVIFAFLVAMAAVLVVDAVLQSAAEAWARRRAEGRRLESLGRLAGGLAHDFNNQLQIIIGYTELLRKRVGGDAEATGDADRILDASWRAGDLARELLIFARSPEGDARDLRLSERLRRVHQMLRRLLPEDLALELALPADEVVVRADPGAIDQIVTNLVLNARDAVRSGGTIRIELGAPSASPPDGVPLSGEVCRLAVTDDGVGMDRSTVERAFEPFFSTKEVGEGSGLGLSVVWGLVRGLGGTVTIRSEPGAGTRVDVWLPVREERDGGEEEPRRGSGDVASSAAPRRVLVVEDDAEVRRALREVLESAGHTVLEAADAASAVTVGGEARPAIDLAVLDVVLPDDSGVELARTLDEVRPGLPVVYVSGHSREALVGRGLSREIPVLRKPVSAHDLLAAVGASGGGSRD